MAGLRVGRRCTEEFVTHFAGMLHLQRDLVHFRKRVLVDLMDKKAKL